MKIWIIVWLTLAGWVQAQDEVAGVMFTVGSTNEPRVVLPLKKTEVKIDVTAGIARTEVVQRFKNDINRPLEAVYIFPLPSEAAIEAFEIRLKDRVIKSTVKEREEARAAYEEAKAEGKRTALLEQERPNLFTTSVANLLPGETVDICFAYVEPLRFRKDRYDITFPMVVGERYIPFKFSDSGGIQETVPDAGRLNPPFLHPNLDSGHRLSIMVELNGLPVDRAVSSTHAIKVRAAENNRHTVSLRRNVTVPNCEFNLTVHLKKNETPSVTFVQSAGEETYGLLSVFPPIGSQANHTILPKDVVFLIDTSGSMSGESMAQARSGLSRCLGILKPQDRFTVVRFASDFSWFAPELREASELKAGEARDYIAGLEASGGTEMQPALEHVLDMLPQQEGRMPLVVFLTDGCVGNEETLLNLLAAKLGNTRLFTFGIGSAPNEFLMSRMADAGRGQSRFIRSHEDIGEVMTDFFATLESPVLTDVAVEWENPGVNTYPARCPDIFFGRPLRLVARAAGGFGGQVTVTGILSGERQHYTVDISGSEKKQHAAIETLYGRMQIKDLMVDFMQTDEPDSMSELKQAIIDVALRHQLVSRFTSRVAVEEKVVVENGALVSVDVSVPVPKGWTMYSTATHEMLGLLSGGLLLAGACWFRRMSRAA